MTAAQAPGQGQQQVIAGAAFHYFLQVRDNADLDVWGAQTDTQRLSLDGLVDCKALAEFIVKALGWQPMDTAPQDGAVILLSHIGGISLVRWDKPTNWWEVMHDDTTPALERDAGNYIGPPHIMNTEGLRWMPRPAKPGQAIDPRPKTINEGSIKTTLREPPTTPRPPAPKSQR